MAKETERKFLVIGDAWKQGSRPVYIAQAYLSTAPNPSVRVRVWDRTGYVTIKSRGNGLSRDEYEYEIPVEDAKAMIRNLAITPAVEKTRYLLPAGEFTWEIDEFHGANEGLVVAEIELPEEDTPFERPSWLGREVSMHRRYFNSSLARHPFSRWSDEEKSE